MKQKLAVEVAQVKPLPQVLTGNPALRLHHVSVPHLKLLWEMAFIGHMHSTHLLFIYGMAVLNIQVTKTSSPERFLTLFNYDATHNTLWLSILLSKGTLYRTAVQEPLL